MYNLLKKDVKPEIDNLYPNFEWNDIWKNVNFKYINNLVLLGHRPLAIINKIRYFIR